MSGVCPAPGPDDPLVRSLLTVVDCNVQAVAQTSYFTLFQPGGAYPAVLSALLVCYVALIGYRLLLGRSQLQITDFALTALKLGAVVALATQWSTYQTVVYRTLFFGPEQIADAMLHSLRANGSILGGDVFEGLQRAVGDLTSFSPATPPGAPAAANAAAGGLTAAGSGQLSTLLSKAGFDSLLLLGSAVVLLISTLGVLLASKIVLGLLLGLGPVFIALMLFESTQGLFEGWLRAAVAFAFAPLAITLLLGLSLTLLEPSLQQIEAMRASSSYLPGVAFAVAVLVMVTAAVAAGLLIAGGVIAAAFHIPGRRVVAATIQAGGAPPPAPEAAAVQARAARTASALVAQDRREAAGRALIASVGAPAAPPAEDRRTTVITPGRTGSGTPDVAARLGQEPRRGSGPRRARAGARAEAGRA